LSLFVDMRVWPLARRGALPFLSPDRHDHFEAARPRNRARRRGTQVGTIDVILA
jgi:hypothetical protein